ncbi:MAG: hypothetical protein JWN64_12 [Parcubacteria group bacterium]|nr:hypothetical protein [Parcubacteria group bacterium]
MKIWITGAAGAVGSHAAEQLALAGHDVSGIDAYTDFYDPAFKERNAHELQEKGIPVTKGDLATDKVSGFIPADTEFIFHFAAQPGISSLTSYDTYVRNNLTATHHLLEAACGLSSLKGFVYISTSSVYGARANGSEEVLPEPTSVYGVTKLAAEQLALSYARDGRLPVSVLRFFSVYGERERPDKLFRKLAQAIDRGEPFPLYEGSENHIRSFTYVRDSVQACVRIVEDFSKHVGQIFNIGTDITATTGEAIALIEGVMGKKGVYDMRPPRQGDQIETRASIEKARKAFGYEPKTTLEEGIRNEIAWYQSL